MGELHNTYNDSACNCITRALNTLGKLMHGRHTILNLMLVITASIFVLATLVGPASATDYYVSMTGNNSNNGLTLGTAWASIQYGFETMHAGDTLYVVNGTYYEEPVGTYKACISGEYIDHNANETHQVTLTAYNGTPTIVKWKSTIEAGVMLVNDDYINIDGITLDGVNSSNRLPEGIRTRSCRNVNITNCSVYYTSTGIQIYQRGNYTIIENCSVYNTYWNAITLSNNGLDSGAMHHISVLNCTINHTDDHNGIDMIDNLEYINLIGNSITGVRNGIYVHGTDSLDYHFHDGIIQDNTITNSRTNGIYVNRLYNWTISDNIVTDSGSTSITMAQAHNITFSNNTANTPAEVSGTDITSDSDTIYSHRLVSGDLIVRDFGGNKRSVKSYDGITDVEILFTDCTVMSSVRQWDAGFDFYHTPVGYYPDKSNFTMGSTGVGSGLTRLVTSYNITLRPTYAHLYDVTVDTWDEDSDTYRITARSTVPDNPTWINLTTKAASATYDITSADAGDFKATTDADGVLRYRYNKLWNGPQTFEISYASDGADPEPIVTNFQNETPTQQTVTLFWDCSVSDVDYYTIYQDGTLLAITDDPYYVVTNLRPDTIYTFSTSATAASITGKNATLSVQTAAEEAEGFGSNTASITEDVTASRGDCVTTPIMIHNATGVACAGVKLTYDPGVVTVTGVTEGDFTSYFGFDDEHAAEGWVMINTYINKTQLTGAVKVTDVTLTAAGEVGATSILDMEIISMADQNGYAVHNTVSNGLFTVVSDTSPPVVTCPSASQLIPDDTDGVPSWGETTTLSVTVTDESDIASVTIDLSAIGGSPVQPMTHTEDNVWSVTTSASAGTLPRTYKLRVSATDIYGYTNLSESVKLVVMQNGDVTGDNDVSSDDIILLRTYVTYMGHYTVSNESVADVTGDGVVNIADAMLLENHVERPDQYTLR